MNKIHKDLQFKATEEVDNKISFLDLLINRKNSSLSIDIYRKPTTTDTTIHYKSNHPTQHKIAACRYMINRLNNLPLSQEQRHQEWNTILQIAQNNGYPITLINKLNKSIITKRNRITNNTLPSQINNRIWVTFEYHNPIITKVTNIFNNTNIKIAFRVRNTTQNILKPAKTNNDCCTNSGIYSLQCKTCHKHYIGQTGRSLKAGFLEHQRYIKYNDPKSAYALHILKNRHEYGPIDNTMELIKSCKKGRHMNILENYYMQLFQKQNLLIDEQIPLENNLLFKFITPPLPLIAGITREVN